MLDPKSEQPHKFRVRRLNFIAWVGILAACGILETSTSSHLGRGVERDSELVG